MAKDSASKVKWRANQAAGRPHSATHRLSSAVEELERAEEGGGRRR